MTVSELSPEEKLKHEELKKRIYKDYGPIYDGDGQLRRFLKARNFDLKAAEEMLRNHLEARKFYGIDTILVDYAHNEILERHFQLVTISCSRFGNPVFYCDVGHTDFKGLLKSVSNADVIRYLVYFVASLENLMMKQTKKLKKTIDNVIAIVDFNNLSISQALFKPTIDIGLEIFRLYEANFPERLKSGYLINTSPIFYILFNCIKPMFTSHTLNKLQIYEKDGWQETILKDIGSENLPVFLGGKKTGSNGDPYCNVRDVRKPVSPEFYFRSPQRRLREKPNVKDYLLRRGEKTDITFNIDEINSSIQWDFETEKGDIAFGLAFQSNNNDLEWHIPIHNVKSYFQIESGTFTCKKTGIYLLTLDNSYSWLREKHIFCKASIVKPNGENIIVTQ